VKVAVIDYGVGNLGSVFRSLEELKVKPILVDRPVDIYSADSIILPGVGNFAECAKILEKDGWSKVLLEEVVQREKPILGICLGMQLLASFGFEGLLNKDKEGTKGLGLIPGSVINLKDLGCDLNIPHVGWNEVKYTNISKGLFNEIPENTDFYFVHSYVFLPENPDHIVAKTEYNVSVVAAVRNKHIWGTQFHPEKSSRAGLKLLENFINNPTC
jgi:imidazole glycerol-phosphate synthase subunit HisH